MAGASRERENPTDQRCQYCARFFSAQGIGPHEENCPVRELGLTADEFDFLDEEGNREYPEPQEANPKSQPVEADGGNPSGADPRDDEPGGPRDPPQFDTDTEPTRDVVDDVQDECPSCGSPDWFDPAHLPDDVLEHAPELAEFDRACMDCSTDDSGHLAAEIEVYNT